MVNRVSKRELSPFYVLQLKHPVVVSDVSRLGFQRDAITNG